MVNPARAAAVAGLPVGEMLPLLLNPFWANLDPKILAWPKDFFIYGVEFLPLPNNTTQRQTFQIQSDSHFLVMAGVGKVTSTDDTTTFLTDVPQLYRIFDAGSGREVMNLAIHYNNLFGTAQLPAYWPYPKIFKANTTVEVEGQNLDTVNDRNVRLAFWGFKLFRGQGYKVVLD